MFRSSWQRFLNSLSPKARGKSRRDRRQAPAKPSRRLRLEQLEARITPAVHDLNTAGTFTTIQAAVNAANPGDTILADAGTYAESVTVNKSLTIEGAQHGVDAQNGRPGAMESILDASTNGGKTLFYVTASDVTIDGFTVQNETSSNQFGFGILLGAGTSGSHILNNIIQDNIAGLSLANGAGNQTVIEHNLFQNNNQPGPASGNAIYSDQFNAGGALTNVLIDSNTFSGDSNGGVLLASSQTDSQSNITISNNTFTNEGNAVLLTNTTSSSITGNTITGSLGSQVVIGDNDSGVSITNNLIQNGSTNGIRVVEIYSEGPASNVTANDNSIQGNASAGLRIDSGAYSGTLDATNNWWGSATGPTTPNNLGGTGDAIIDPDGVVTFSPYLTDGTNAATGRGFDPVANASTGIAVVGTSGDDTLVVNATGPDSGTYSLNGGAPVPFSGVTRFSFAGLGGADTFIINNPAGGLFAPTDGIFDDGGGQAGDNLQDLGGSATGGSYTPNPSGSPQNAGTLTHTNGAVTQTITFTGLAPVTDTVTEPTFTYNSTDVANGAIFYQDDGNSGATHLNTIFDQSPGAESLTFGNKMSVTVNTDLTAAGAAKTVDVQFATPATALTSLAFNDNGGGGSGFDVLATPAAVAAFIIGNANGHDSVSVSDNQAKLDQILGPVRFIGSGAGNSLFVTDTGSTTPYTYTITGTTINRSGGAVTPGTITYSGVQTLQLSGGSGGNTISMTGAAAGTGYTINAGSGNDSVNVQGTGSAAGLTVNGQGGADTLLVNFAAGNPSPAAGINYHGGGQAGDTLLLVGVNANTVTNTFLPDSGGTPHRGTINLDGSVVNYDGVFPVSISGTMANLVINLPTGDGDNQAILEDNGNTGDNTSQIRSGNGTFETTQFTNPTTSLTVNTGNDGETVTFAHLDPAYNPTNGATITGGTGQDTLHVDFSSGVNVIPTGGITFNGGADNGDAIIFTAGYAATSVTDNYTNNHSGSIVVDGRTLTYSGLSQTRGIFDPLAASTRAFAFASTISNNITLGDDPVANNGFSRISSTASNPTTDFRNPTTSVTVQLGNAGDTITAGPLDAVSPPPTINLNGGAGSDTFNVTPSTGSTFNVDGNLPNPPATPGDTLNVAIPPGSNPVLTSVATPTGFTGNYTFLSGGFHPVNFTRIETLNPSTVTLTITKDDGGDTEGEVPGTTITYTIVAANTGTLGVTGVTITDTFPSSMPPSTAPGFSGDSWTATQTGGASGFSATGSGNINDAVTMPAGSAITYIVTAVINPSSLGTLSNTATITPPTGVTASPSSSTDADTLTPQADLGVTKTPTPSPVLAGNNLTYTITVSNNGPSTSQNVQLTDATPNNTTFVSFTENSGPTFTVTQQPAAGGTGFVTATDASLLPNMPAVFTFVVHVSPSTANGSTINNTATVLSTTTVDTAPGNNQINTMTPVNTQADLSVSKTGPASPVTAGNNLTYTIALTNNGPSDAQNVSLTDAVPAGTTFVSFTPAAGFTRTDTTPPGGTSAISATDAAFAAGASATFTLVVHANAGDASGSTISSTANVSSTTPDPTADNASTVTSTVATSADLALAKTGPPTATAGTNVTYTLSVTNNGPSDAQAVNLTDTLPTGETFVSASAGTGSGTSYNSGNLGVLAAFGSEIVTIVARISPSAGSGSILHDTATVSSSTSDPTSADNTATFDTTVTTSANLAVVKTGPAAVTAGTNATYTITVTNNGPSDSQGVTLSDTVPSGSTFVSFAQNSGPTFSPALPPPNGTGTLNDFISTFAAGASATFTLVLHINASDANGSNFANTAMVASSGTPDATTADNASTATATVQEVVDLSITKTDNQTTAHPGLPLTYTIVVGNAGPSDATAATVTDNFPSNLTNVTFTATQTGGASGFTASGSGNIHDTVNVPVGATITYTVTGTVSSSATSGTLSNTATVAPASGVTDTNLGNNSATVANALAPVSGAIVVNGANGDAMLVINATDAQSGTYQVTTAGVPGPVVPFTAATSFAFNGTPESQEGADNDGPTGHDAMTVNNPSGGLFAPANGIFFNGVGAADLDTLQILGGAHTSEVHNLAPNSADGSHNGSIVLFGSAVTAFYTYTGLSTVLVNAGTPQAIAFNLPNNGMDNQTVLQASGTPGQTEITSQTNGFETTTFADPSTSLTVNLLGPANQTMTVGSLDAGFTAPIGVNGGPGFDTLVLPAGSLPVGTLPTALFLPNGGQEVLFTSIEGLSVTNPAAVQAIGGPDTADRATAFTGLTAQERFVQALYLDELGRAGAKSELDAWAALFDTAGQSQAQAQAAIATGIDHSSEAADHLVKGWYQAYLGRAAQGGEEQGWVNVLVSGQTEEQVLSQFFATPEFFNRAQTLISSGTANERFVQLFYLDVFNRQDDAAAVVSVASAVPLVGRQGVALDLLTEPVDREFLTDQVAGYNDALLHRPADALGLHGWVFSNLDMESIRIQIEATPEFFTNG